MRLRLRLRLRLVMCCGLCVGWGGLRVMGLVAMDTARGRVPATRCVRSTVGLVGAVFSYCCYMKRMCNIGLYVLSINNGRSVTH